MMGKKEGEAKEELALASSLAQAQRLPYYFDTPILSPLKEARLPREAAWDSRLKTLLAAFDIPEPVL